TAAGGSDAQRHLLQLPDEGSGDAADGSAAEETSEVYLRALELMHSEFEETSWQAFWRVAVEGQAPADVAAALQMTVNAVYLAKSRVLCRLREEFADLLEADGG